MQTLYNIFIFFYYQAIKLASVFNNKASLWIDGRKNLLEKIALELDHEADHVWFHCASSGEFEQGRPLIEKFKKDNPSIKIVLTFFSASGYEMRKNNQHADHVFYMPLDTIDNARRFIAYVKPKLAIFVKYEYWFNHLNVLHENKIPVVFVSAIFFRKQIFFRWWGSWYRNQLKKITYFFVQDKASQNLLYSIGVRNAVVSGDTRFDRVFEISSNPKSFEKAEKFIQGSVIFIGGSTWPADDQILVPLINQDKSDIKFLLVPHEIDPVHIEKLKSSIKHPVVIWSAYDEEAFRLARVLIVDQMGMLSHLYQYASIAYIGGGFGKGIHNTLEAATFGMPVIFGPKYEIFTEAVDLVNFGGAFPVNNQNELIDVFNRLCTDYSKLKEAADVSKNYVSVKRGASDTIMVFINAIISPASYKSKAIEMMNMN
jgi:3-deoxy-D-manno-octulosonic-acid transferase